MARLYHYWLSPGSRFVRLLLGEKGIPFELILEMPWEMRPGFLQLSPSGWPPVLAMGGGVSALSDSRAIAEYIEETNPAPNLMGNNAMQRAEVRRVIGWCDSKLAAEVLEPLLFERFYRNEMNAGSPASATIRACRQNLPFHLTHLSSLDENRRWMAGDEITQADLMTAASLSVLDYLNEISWEKFPELRDWYSRVKSRPSFRPLLSDRVAGFPPSDHYADLDF